MNITWSMFKAVVILPGTALVYVPGLIIWFTRNTAYSIDFPPENVFGWAGVIILTVPGLVLMGWTVRLFASLGGGGSPAPWDPIQNFIVTGPYLYVRNPMLTGVLLAQAAMAMFFQSWPLAIWMVFFFCLNTVYFKFSEEPGLEKRYGEPYQAYCRNVNRWVPRFSPYGQSEGA